MFAMRRSDLESVGGLNDRDRIAPGVAAALIGCGLSADVIVLTSLAKLRVRRCIVIVRMPGLMLRVAVCGLCRRGMIVILRGRARVARSGEARKGKRNGNGQDDDSTTLHGFDPETSANIDAGGVRCKPGGIAARNQQLPLGFARTGSIERS